jgi:hypothetical protein
MTDDLDAESLDCLGLHRADAYDVEERRARAERHAAYIDAMAPAPEPRRRVRKPSLESQVRQVMKAAKAAGVSIALTVEGDTVTATPMSRAATQVSEPPADAPAGRSLFKMRQVPTNATDPDEPVNPLDTIYETH